MNFSDAVKTAVETGDISELKRLSREADKQIAARAFFKNHAHSKPQDVVIEAEFTHVQPDNETETDDRRELTKDKANKGETRSKRKKGDGSVFQRGAVWWIKYYRNAKAYRESSESKKEGDARKLLKKRQGEIAVGRFIGPEAEKVIIRELSEDFKNDYRVNGKNSLDKAEQTLKHLLAFFGDYRAHDIGTDLIRKYAAQRQQEKASNGTINRELSALRRIFNLALQAEKIYRKPHIPLLEENNVRTGFFEHAEFIALRNAAPEYFKPVVTFAYYTGWRTREILSLKWNQVDLNARTARLDPGTTKSKEGRLVILDGELLEAIQEQWERRKVAEIPGQSPTLLCPYVFHRNGKPMIEIRKVWTAACKEANLAGKLLHDFRRTAVRNMVRAGINERVAMKISGHKTRSVFDRYNIVSEDDLKEAARRTWEHAQSQERESKVVPLRSNQ
jgi:integrase